MMVIPAGSFTMGAPPGEEERAGACHRMDVAPRRRRTG